MAIEKAITSASLTKQQCQGLAPAYAEIAMSLSGRVRYLYELATGTPAHTDGAATSTNPQGYLGVDRSGPPWGDALLHPLWIAEGALSSTDYYGEKPLATTRYQYTTRVFASFFVRPFQMITNCPYSIGKFVLQANKIGTANSTFTVKIYSVPNNEVEPSSATVTTTSQTAFTTSTVLNVPLTPGWNAKLIEFYGTTTGTGDSGSSICVMGISQQARRSH